MSRTKIYYNNLYIGFMSSKELAINIFKIELVTLLSRYDNYLNKLSSYCDFTKVEGGVIITRLKF